MADNKKKEVPKHIKEFYDRDARMRRLLDTTAVAHSEAYLAGVKAITNDKGEVDYDLLDNAKKQDAMLEKMMDVYMSRALKAQNIKEKPEEEFDQDVIMKRYIGVTKNELRRIMRQAKSDYTLEHHEKIRGQLIQKQHGELSPLRHSHFEESHMESILKHTGVGDYLNPKRITAGHAASLLDLYKHRGEITLNDLSEITSKPEEKGGWGLESKAYLTEKGEEAIKGLKVKYKKAA
jgi:hypothetical protein